MQIYHKINNFFSLLNTSRNKQYAAVIIVMVFVLGTILIISETEKDVLIDDDENKIITHKNSKIELDVPSKIFDSNKNWREYIESSNKQLNKKIEEKEKTIDFVIDEFQQSNKSTQQILQNFENKLKEFEQKNQERRAHDIDISREEENKQYYDVESQITQISIPLSNKNNQESENLKTVDTIIPGGTRVKAIIIGGIDASTASHAQSEPKPVMMHLMEDGITPRNFKVEMEGCILQGNAYAERSSQRAFIRLNEFNCVERLTGEVISRSIQGWVYGPDGKLGIQGKYVDLSGKLLSNSAVSGIFGGLSNVIAPQVNLFNPFSGATSLPYPKTEERFLSGAATGATNAMDELSRYYLEEAKQYHAIVEVPAGIMVDVVIEKDVDVSETLFKQTISIKNDEQRREKVRTYDINYSTDNIFKNNKEKNLNTTVQETMNAISNNPYLKGQLK